MDPTVNAAVSTSVPGFVPGVGGAAGALGTPGIGGFARQPEAPEVDRVPERRDRILALAKWSGAMREVQISGDANRFAQRVRELLDFLAPLGTEGDQFQNIMCIATIFMGQNQNLAPAASAALALFPARLDFIIKDPMRMNSLDVGGPWQVLLDSWPYATYQSTWDVPDDKLAEICVQAIYEGAFVLNIAPNGYLEDEEARIEGGLYPDSIRPIIQRTYAKCSGVDVEDWGHSADQRAEGLLAFIAPFGHPTTYRKLAGTIGMAMPMPRQEKLTDWELRHLFAFATDQEFDRAEVLNVLVARWEALTDQMSRMDEALRSFFLTQHTILTACVNMRSRRASAKHHRDRGNFLANRGPLSVDYGAIIRQAIDEKTPHYNRCLWPEVESLFVIEYRVRRQLEIMAEQAKQSAPAAQPAAQPAAPQAAAADIPPPPEGRGNGVRMTNGEIYYPHLPFIPLDEKDAEIRRQASEFCIDHMEVALAEDAGGQARIMADIRELVSGNLKAFGLKEEHYAKMDDETLTQYIMDI